MSANNNVKIFGDNIVSSNKSITEELDESSNSEKPQTDDQQIDIPTSISDNSSLDDRSFLVGKTATESNSLGFLPKEDISRDVDMINSSENLQKTSTFTKTSIAEQSSPECTTDKEVTNDNNGDRDSPEDCDLSSVQIKDEVPSETKTESSSEITTTTQSNDQQSSTHSQELERLSILQFILSGKSTISSDSSSCSSDNTRKTKRKREHSSSSSSSNSSSHHSTNANDEKMDTKDDGDEDGKDDVTEGTEATQSSKTKDEVRTSDEDTDTSESLTPDKKMKADLNLIYNVGNGKSPSIDCSSWSPILDMFHREVYRNHSRYPPDSYIRKAGGSLYFASRLEEMHTLEYHRGCVNCLNFNAEGNILLSGSDDLKVCLWDWKARKTILHFSSGHRSNVFQCKFMPFTDHQLIVTCARDGQVRLAELSQTGICHGTRKICSHRGGVHKLGMKKRSPHTFYSAGEDGVLYNIDLRLPKQTKLFTTNETVMKPIIKKKSSSSRVNEKDAEVNDTEVRKEKNRKESNENDDDDMETRKNDEEGGETDETAGREKIITSQSSSSSSYGPSLAKNTTSTSDVVEPATTGGNEQQQQQDPPSPKMEKSLKKIPLYSVDAHPFNEFLFCTGGRDVFTRVYDLRKCTLTSNPGVDNPLTRLFPPELEKSPTRPNVTAVVYSFDGKEIISSLNDDDIYLFEPDSGVTEPVNKYHGHRHNATVKGVNFFGPRSEFVVSGSDCSHVYIWEKRSAKIVNFFHADDGGVTNCLEPHPHDPILATSGLDHQVKIWEPTLEQPATMPELGFTMRHNARDRAKEHSASAVDYDSELFDGAFIWQLMRRLRRRRRRNRRDNRRRRQQQRQEGRACSGESENAATGEEKTSSPSSISTAATSNNNNNPPSSEQHDAQSSETSLSRDGAIGDTARRGGRRRSRDNNSDDDDTDTFSDDSNSSDTDDVSSSSTDSTDGSADDSDDPGPRGVLCSQQ